MEKEGRQRKEHFDQRQRDEKGKEEKTVERWEELGKLRNCGLWNHLNFFFQFYFVSLLACFVLQKSE